MEKVEQEETSRGGAQEHGSGVEQKKVVQRWSRMKSGKGKKGRTYQKWTTENMAEVDHEEPGRVKAKKLVYVDHEEPARGGP